MQAEYDPNNANIDQTAQLKTEIVFLKVEKSKQQMALIKETSLCKSSKHVIKLAGQLAEVARKLMEHGFVYDASQMNIMSHSLMMQKVLTMSQAH